MKTKKEREEEAFKNWLSDFKWFSIVVIGTLLMFGVFMALIKYYSA